MALGDHRIDSGRALVGSDCPDRHDANADTAAVSDDSGDPGAGTRAASQPFHCYHHADAGAACGAWSPGTAKAIIAAAGVCDHRSMRGVDRG